MIIKHLSPRFRSKICFIDYDWTIVKPNKGAFPKDVNDWTYLRKNVKDVIKSQYAKGYMIVIVTNQSKEWKTEQINNVMKDINIPCVALIATSKEYYKPSLNIYHEYFGDKVSKINKEKSFMCGDASGRQNDHSDSDLEFAKNLKIKFIIPEDFFPLQNTIFEVDKYRVEQKEIIVMVGFPGSGKTTVAKKFTEYINIESDTYKTTSKMLKIAKRNIDKSVIFNATNPTKSKRKEYIDYAREHNINIRCFYVSTSMSDSLANNALREKPVPKIVYNIYNSKFEMPTITEGFNDVIII